MPEPSTPAPGDPESEISEEELDDFLAGAGTVSQDELPDPAMILGEEMDEPQEEEINELEDLVSELVPEELTAMPEVLTKVPENADTLDQPQEALLSDVYEEVVTHEKLPVLESSGRADLPPPPVTPALEPKARTKFSIRNLMRRLWRRKTDV